tara:strand:- start:418 stop:756 length:339 start_codon:yes stop_codon:yes gene_type:complete
MSDYKEQERLAGQDPRVQAIRNHPLLNASSCTTISECFADVELLEYLKEAAKYNQGQQLTPAEAVEWALDYEGMQREAALNTRQGSDDDPELRSYREWREDLHSQSHPDQQV